MAEVVRRILWLVPVLVAGAFTIFFAFGSGTHVKTRLSRPLFYNPAPVSAQVAAREALERTRQGDPAGAKQLAILGGAALPLVLEELPGLSVKDQRAVGEGLEPVARRMRLRRESELSRVEPSGRNVAAPSADQALLFWERYRDEHALDLRPLATSRLVKRATQRDSGLQNADLLAVDTYALPTLVSSIGRISEEADVARARRLAAAISHATETDFTIGANATVEQARTKATEIRRFWDEHGAQWTQLGRSELLVAQFSQTEFASWIFRTARQLSGLDQPEIWYRLSRRGSISISLAAFCLLGLLVVGPTVAATIQVLQLRRSRWQLERWGLRAGLAMGLMALTPLLVGSSSQSWVRLSLVGLATGTVFSAFILQRELNDRLDWRTHHVLRGRSGVEKVGAIFRWLAPSVPTLTPLAVAEAALWVTCLEVSSKTRGLGEGALAAYKSGDVDYLMALCLGLGLATGISQIFADLLLGSDRSPRGET